MTDDDRILNLRNRIMDLRQLARTDASGEILREMEELATRRDELKSRMDRERDKAIAEEMARIEEAVSGVFRIDVETMLDRSERRPTQDVADAVHAVFFAVWKRQLPICRAAERMNRDHSTAIYGRDKMKDMYETNERLREMLDEVMFCVS